MATKEYVVQNSTQALWLSVPCVFWSVHIITLVYSNLFTQTCTHQNQIEFCIYSVHAEKNMENFPVNVLSVHATEYISKEPHF